MSAQLDFYLCRSRWCPGRRREAMCATALPPGHGLNRVLYNLESAQQELFE
jgi:hypothetical protein